MLSDWVDRRRQPDRDAARRTARRPARPDRRRDDARQRLSARRRPSGRRAPASSARRSSSTAPPTATRSAARRVATLYSSAASATANPGRHAAQRRQQRRPGGGVHLRSRALGRLHAPGQSRLGGTGARRHVADPLRRSVLRRRVVDPQPDWVDLNKVAIPQADEQQRLLANLILQHARDRKPLPRFWYFPRDKRAVVIRPATSTATGRHARAASTITSHESPPGCSVADWECVRATSYIYPGSDMDDAEAAASSAQGFELGVHVNTGCADWTPASLDDVLRLAARRASRPSPEHRRRRSRTARTASRGATGRREPQVELEHGIRLDTNYYYWPPGLGAEPARASSPARACRCASPRRDGALIDVYQAVTQMTDESGQTYPFTIDTLLDRALGPLGYYGAFTANMHTDSGRPRRRGRRSSRRRRRAACRSSRRGRCSPGSTARNSSAFGIDRAERLRTLDFSIAVAARARPACGPCCRRRSARSRVVGTITRNAAPGPFTRRRSRASVRASSTRPPGTYRRLSVRRSTAMVTARACRRTATTPTRRFIRVRPRPATASTTTATCRPTRTIRAAGRPAPPASPASAPPAPGSASAARCSASAT